MGNNNIERLLSLVDWNQQARRPFVVADPMDPNNLLYMTDKDYQVLLRTALSNNESLIVIARPGSKRPEPVNSNNTPDNSGTALQD